MRPSLPVLALLGLSTALVSGCVVHVTKTETSNRFVGFTKQVTLEANNGEFETIQITGPDTQVSAEYSESGRVVVSAGISGGTPGEIDAFIGSTSRNAQGGSLSLHVGGPVYSCFRRTVNGTTLVSGVCVDEIRVSLPASSRTKVYINGRIVGLKGAMSVPDLVMGMRTASFDSDKKALIGAFIRSYPPRGRIVTVADVKEIISQFAFDSGKLEAVEMFRGRVVDPQNAVRIAGEFSFDSSKVPAIEALSE